MESRSRATGQLIWILLFFAFTACVIAALLQAAMVYNNITGVLNDEFSIHTGLNYVQSRVRSGDSGGGVYVGKFDGIDALYCLEKDSDGEYTTIIYGYDGSMRELYCEKGAEFEPDAGEKLLDMDSLGFEDAGSGLIRVTCASGGSTGSIYIASRTEGGGGA
jgi:hypothetical protein